MDKLIEKIIEKDYNPTVAGLDPRLEYVPDFIKIPCMEKAGDDIEKGAAEAIFEFNRALIDALCDIVPAVKPQSAYYEMYGIEGLICLKKTIDYAREKGLYVLLDVKRGDIGATAEAYSAAYLKGIEYAGRRARAFCPDAVTVNPYLGTDGLKPFVNDAKEFDREIFVLVKTSNPSSGELQDLKADGCAIYEHTADIVNSLGEDNIGKYGYNKVGAVVGATYPEEISELRKRMPHTFFLIPGYGAQGGRAEDCALAFDENHLGGIVNSSRAIMCAYKKGSFKDEDFAAAARCEAERMKEALKKCIMK